MLPIQMTSSTVVAFNRTNSENLFFTVDLSRFFIYWQTLLIWFKKKTCRKLFNIACKRTFMKAEKKSAWFWDNKDKQQNTSDIWQNT